MHDQLGSITLATLNSLKESGAKVITIPQVASKNELLAAFGDQLPGMHSNNWDALDEALSGCEGIAQNVVYVVHLGVPGLPLDDMKIYKDILQSVTQLHKNGKIDFHVALLGCDSPIND